MGFTSQQITADSNVNPILRVFRADIERDEPWAAAEYRIAITTFRDDPDSEFDEDGELRLSTYTRVSRCGASPEHVAHAIAVVERIEQLRLQVAHEDRVRRMRARQLSD